MGVFADRATVMGRYFVELARRGLPATTEPLTREVVFVLDGVGGLQFGPLLARQALREQGAEIGTVLFRWQTPVPFDIWTDLMWERRNRMMGLRFARRLLAFRRVHAEAVIHLLAFSGGTGIATFACERLAPRRLMSTLILACPALSPQYNLARALDAVERCYALTSRRDTFILGLGTSLFGTMDRCYGKGAGLTGFQLPAGLTLEERAAYERLREIRWSPELRQCGHHGGHTAWASPGFLSRHLVPLLRGRPELPTYEVGSQA